VSVLDYAWIVAVAQKKTFGLPCPKVRQNIGLIQIWLVFQCAQIDNPRRKPIRSKCTPLPLGRLAKPCESKCSSSSQLGAKVYLKEMRLSRHGEPLNLKSVPAPSAQPKVRLFQRSHAVPKPKAMKGPPRIVASSAQPTRDCSIAVICTILSTTTPPPTRAVVKSAANRAL